MGYELNRLMKQYGVATPTMAGYAGTAAPGPAPAAVAELVKPADLRAQPTAPVRPSDPGRRATPEQRAAYDAALAEYNTAKTAYDNDLKTWRGEKTAYDAAIKSYNAALPKYQEDVAKYNKDKAAFDEQLRKYQLDTKSYDEYTKGYQNRLAGTNMYNQAQFSTTGANVPAITTFSPMQKHALGYGTAPMNEDGTPAPASQSGFGIGQERANQNIRNWFAANPNATPDELADVKQKYGVNDYDIRNALGTGTRYGTPQWTDTVQGPYYGVAPLSLGNKTAQEKADFYLSQRGIGYTDADIRTGAEKNFGKLGDNSWAELLNRAYPQYVNPVIQGYANIGRTGFTGDNAIDYPGYNYWMNQLSTGAATPQNINQLMEAAAFPNGRPTVTIPTTPIGPTILGTTSGTTGGTMGGGTTTNNSTFNTDQTIPVTYDDYGTPIYYGGNNGRDFYNDNIALYSHGGKVHDLAQKYAVGGAVKTHYQTGGRTALGYESPEAEADWQRYWESQRSPVETFAVPSENAPEGAPLAPASPLTAVADERAVSTEPLPPPPVTTPAAPAETPATPTTTPPAAETPRPALDARTAGLQMLLEKYGPQEGGYAQEVAAARQRAQAETTAFTTMLERMMNSPEDERTSKAEMYFRLAAAFGSPTKTGQFTENLALAGKELGEYAKGKRESSAKKRDLMLEVQKMKMGAAKDDLAAVRALEAEAMKDRRAIAQELIKEYIASGKPQSDAGKQAMDMGLRPGTPEYQAKVQELAEFNVQRQMAGINNQLAQLTLAQANLTLRQQTAARLSPTEINMLKEGEDLVSSGQQALRDLGEAYRLNPNSLAGGWLERGQQFLFEAAGSNDPTIVNTRVINNLLGAQGLAKLRATFGGNPTEGERAILLELEGIGSKTREERATIMRRAYRVLQDRVAREQRRIDDLKSGAYRMTEPLPAGGE